MKKYYRLNYILILVLVCALLPFRVEAGYEIPGSCHVQTDTSVAGVIKTLDYGYANNTYLSLRDTAMILRETDKGFSLEITKECCFGKSGKCLHACGNGECAVGEQRKSRSHPAPQ